MKDVFDEEAYLRLLGRRLRDARRRVHMTQAEASELSGLHVNTIRSYEGGRSVPGVTAVVRLADVYGVQSLDALLDPESAK